MGHFSRTGRAPAAAALSLLLLLASAAPAAEEEGGPPPEAAGAPHAPLAPGPAGRLAERLPLERWLRPLRSPRRAREALARRVEALRSRAPALAAPRNRLLVLSAAGGILLLLLLRPLLRGRGDLCVCLAYPEELRGSFRVRLSRRRSGRPGRRPPADPLVGSDVDCAATRYDHPMVARETRFHRLPARLYRVSAAGALSDPESGETLEAPFAEQPVRVRRGRTVRVTFDVGPRECPVDVKVLWDRRPVREARVAVRGQAAPDRFARNGTARLRLPKGTHLLVVGSGDRVAERAIEVSSYRPTWVVVDLAASEELLFKGCPPAAECYLQGDYAGAARALEREGQAQVAHLLLARVDQEGGRLAAAAEHYEAAGRLREAAELRAAGGECAAAAELLGRADEPERAAEMYRAAGDPAAAGEAYERAGDYERAAACYREAGDGPRLLGALERLGAHFEAAEVALARSDFSRAIRNLQHVHPGHARYADACRMLGHTLQALGETDHAIAKLEEALRCLGPDGAPLDVHELLARALEQSGQPERALEAWEAIRRRDAAYPHAATRIEALRKQISARHTSSQRPIAPTLPPRTPPGLARYEILEEIGRGGMGIVFKARDRRLGRVVALKRLPDGLRDHPKAVELFLREARAAAALNHRNIVTLFDADEQDGVYFLTMELLEGEPLPAILHRRGRLKPRDVARLGVQACAGLHYAHERGVIHRDIKTGNLFFTAEKVVKIMDFGLAKMSEEVRRAVTVVAGTPYYMAPEQSAGEDVDARADLYGLGVTLFELATGALPFEEGDVAYHHRHTPPPDPRQRVPALPEALAALLLRLLAKEPAARPEGAWAVAVALQQVLQR